MHYITETERLQRIAQLLVKGIALYIADSANEGSELNADRDSEKGTRTMNRLVEPVIEVKVACRSVVDK